MPGFPTQTVFLGTSSSKMKLRRQGKRIAKRVAKQPGLHLRRTATFNGQQSSQNASADEGLPDPGSYPSPSFSSYIARSLDWSLLAHPVASRLPGATVHTYRKRKKKERCNMVSLRRRKVYNTASSVKTSLWRYET